METQIKSEAFQKFVAATTALMNPELQAWKDRGGKVVGFFCSTVPEEMFTAAGLMPFRMRGTGSTSTELSDAFFSSINCSFPRHTFNQALCGEYDFLDGLVCINSCDHVRRIYDNWIRNLKTPFVQVMSLPRKVQEPQVDWYYDELNILRGQLQEHFGVEITDACVKDAIRLHNEIRALQKQLYELRKGDKPPITGAETLAVMVAGTAMPRELYKELLQELLDELVQSEGSGRLQGAADDRGRRARRSRVHRDHRRAGRPRRDRFHLFWQQAHVEAGRRRRRGSDPGTRPILHRRSTLLSEDVR